MDNFGERLCWQAKFEATTNSTPQLCLPLPFTDAGICFRPLRSGSWVWVGFKDQIWLGNGKTNFGFSRIYYLTISLSVKIIYTKGGGKKPTHNYTTSCGNINDLSCFVVQLYACYGTMLTLLICKPANNFCNAPSILHLHAEHLIASLNALCPNPVHPSPKLLHNLTMLIDLHASLVRNK